MTLAALRSHHQDREVLTAPIDSFVGRTLLEAGKTVVGEPLSDSGIALVSQSVGADRFVGPATQRYALVDAAASNGSSSRWDRLAEAVYELLDDVKAKVSTVHVASLDETGGRGRVAITQRVFGEITPLSEASVLGAGLFSRRRTLVLNADHPIISRAIEVAASEPHFAALVVIKSFFLGRRLDEEMDGKLAAAAEARWRCSRP